MTKNLNYPLAFNHFFDIAVNGTKIFLLFTEGISTFLSHCSNAKEHDTNHEHYQQGQKWAENYHHGQHPNHGNDGRKELGKALAQHITEGVCVVGVQGHGFAVAFAVKVAQGKAFHVAEHGLADFQQGSGGNAQHDSTVGIASNGSHQIDYSHSQQKGNKGA